MLLVTFTVISTFLVNLYITWDRTLTDKYNEVHAISELLDEQLQADSLNILQQPSLSESEKIQALNQELQPFIDNVVKSYPNFGAGYYIKELNSIVAFGPDFNSTGLKDIGTDSEARTVYTTGNDFKFHNYSQTRNGYVVANIHPIVHNGEIVGHTWGNVLLEDVFVMVKKDLTILVFVLAIMLIIAYLGSRVITKQYVLNLSLFKRYILEDEPLPQNVRFTKELNEIYDAYTSNQLLQQQQQESIRQLAYIDQLTNLPNRTSLYINLRTYIKEQQNFALLFIDLDEFKSVNDTQGHHIGDQLLMSIAKRLKSTLKEQDAIYRFGGDEFIVILRHYEGMKQLQKRVKQILHAANTPFYLNEMSYQATISIGVSLFKEHAIEADELIRYADLAMYEAKALGKNQYFLFEARLDELAGEHFEISKLLNEGLAKNQFSLHYQPQVSLHDGTISGFEALIRWQHPEKGFISPAKFIPIAESNGLIVPLGQMVLMKACEMRKALLDEGIDHIRVSVNISIKQFQQQDFIDDVLTILKNTGLDGRYLEIEVTESVAMDQPDVVIGKLKQLQQHNIQISIDDFGMGYSSLNYLKRLPIQQLKIDRAFIQDITAKNDYAIVKSIISIAESLSLEVVAEGVETEQQVNLLKDLNCMYVQGYYYYKPMPPNELIKLFTKVESR